MIDEFYANCDLRKFDLNCAVVSCTKNLRLMYATYKFDSLGNAVPAEVRGPYLTEKFDFGQLTNKNHEPGLPGLHQLVTHQGRRRVRRYSLNYRLNDFADGQPDMPPFGFQPSQVFWICQGDERALQWAARLALRPVQYYHASLLRIVEEAAAYEKRIHNQLFL